MTEFIGVKGTKHDLSRLKEILNEPGSIKNWQVEIDPTSSNTNRSVQVITSENKHTISYQEYRNLIKNKNEYDFIYDDLIHRFYKKDHPSIPSGRYEVGEAVIRCIAQATFHCTTSSAIAADINKKASSVRQAKQRINTNLFPDLIQSPHKAGYSFNNDVKWMVLIERV